MKLFKILLLVLLIFAISNCGNYFGKKESESLSINFKEDENKFKDFEKQLIQEVIINSEKEVRTLLPNLTDSIKVIIEIVDWDLEIVDGVTGRTESNSPPLVAIQISKKFSGGITQAVNTALRATIFHEFHHLYRGWAIKDNKFEQGIAIAAVNEGLAVVFAEEYSGHISEANKPPQEDIADSWAKEIIALPKNANYQKWMFEHPDGRQSIGYRIGNFLIRKAIAKSSKNVIELSENTPDQLLKLAGY